MKKICLPVFIFISFMIIGTSATLPQPEETKPEYKNLKILPKKIAREDLKKVMEHYNAALGVKCGFCHVKNEATTKLDFASDAKEEKRTARSMMKMTNKLNIKNFGGKKGQYNQAVMEVTCKTCHHGKTEPEG